MRKIIFGLGCLTAFVILTVAGLFGFAAIERAITTPHLNEGTVTAKCYNDGHIWYSKWTWGNLTYTEKHGGEPYYFIEVSDKGVSDYWTINADIWEKLAVGDYVRR